MQPRYHVDAVKLSLLPFGCCEIDKSSYNSCYHVDAVNSSCNPVTTWMLWNYPFYHLDAVKLTRALTIPVTTWMLLIARATPLPRGCCETIPFTMWMLWNLQELLQPRYHVDAVKLTRALTIPVTMWMLLNYWSLTIPVTGTMVDAVKLLSSYNLCYHGGCC